jgi:hypothetical protein
MRWFRVCNHVLSPTDRLACVRSEHGEIGFVEVFHDGQTVRFGMVGVEGKVLDLHPEILPSREAAEKTGNGDRGKKNKAEYNVSLFGSRAAHPLRCGVCHEIITPEQAQEADALLEVKEYLMCVRHAKMAAASRNSDWTVQEILDREG